MLRNENSRKFLATLFTGVYLFVALFSQLFHDHSSADVFREFHFQKAEKTFSQNKILNDFGDCLSCHIAHEGKYVLPKDFVFLPTSLDTTSTIDVVYATEVISQKIFHFQLRGPPENFIS